MSRPDSPDFSMSDEPELIEPAQGFAPADFVVPESIDDLSEPTMPEEPAQIENSNASDRKSPEAPSFIKRVRYATLTAVAALGIAVASVQGGGDRPVIAQQPISETPTPTVVSNADALSFVYFPRLDVPANVHATQKTPVGPTETASPTATIATATAQAHTETPTASHTPSPTDTEVPPSPTATEPDPTATATEISMLKELSLSIGTKLYFPSSSTLMDADVLENGSVSSGAAAAGLTFDTLLEPHLDEDMRNIIGEVNYPGDDPETSIFVEQRHNRVIAIPLGSVPMEQRQRIRLFDQNIDSEVDYRSDLWNGPEEYIFFGTAASDGEGMQGGTIMANLDTQSIEMDIDAFSEGQVGKSTKIVLGTPGESPRSLNRVILEFVAGTGVTNIRNAQLHYNLSDQEKGLVGNIHDNDKTREAERTGLLDANWGDVIYSTKGQINFVLNKNSITIAGVNYSLPYGLTGTVLQTNLYGDGNRQASTKLHIKSAHRRFTKLDKSEPVERPENISPSLSELANKAGIMIIAPVLPEGLSSQPGLDELFMRTGQILNTNNRYGINERAQQYYEDKKHPTAEVLRTDKSDSELIEQMSKFPGGIVQMSPYGTPDGYSGGWFNKDGTLSVQKNRVFKILRAAKELNVKVILDSSIIADTTAVKKISQNPSTLDNINNFLSEVLAEDLQDNIVFTLSGDMTVYPNQNSEVLISILTGIRNKGIQTGLMHVQANSFSDSSWYAEVLQVLTQSGSNLIGFETDSSSKGSGLPMGIYEYNNDPPIQYRFRQYSPGFSAFRDALIHYLNQKDQVH